MKYLCYNRYLHLSSVVKSTFSLQSKVEEMGENDNGRLERIRVTVMRVELP